MYCQVIKIKKDTLLKNIKEDLEFGKRKNCVQVIFTGENPCNYVSIVDAIKQAKKLNYYVIQMKSSAAIMSDMNFAKRIIRAGLTELIIPIYHYKFKIHDKIICSKEDLLKNLHGIKNVMLYSSRHRPYFDVSISIILPVCRQNINDLDNIIKFVISIGIKQVFILKDKIKKDNLIKYLEKINFTQYDKKAFLFLVGFDNLDGTLKKYSYELFRELNKKNMILPLK